MDNKMDKETDTIRHRDMDTKIESNKTTHRDKHTKRCRKTDEKT